MPETLPFGFLLGGRYLIGQPIGGGGGSAVYHGLDRELDRDVAVKVLTHDVISDDRARHRFEREARALSRLNDPHLVGIYDKGITDTPFGTRAFLVLELVPGGTLRDLVNERGPMPPHYALTVLTSVLTGLATAHHANMVHRDIKPDNILVSATGQVKLTDFGLVRVARFDSGITAGNAATGAVHGTAGYLSPEQIRDDPLTTASDVYSVGLVLVELLTGRAPFRGADARQTALQRLTHDVPAPSALVPGIPARVDGLVLRATHRDPSRRFPDAGSFLRALTEVRLFSRFPLSAIPAPKNSRVNTTLRATLPSPPLPWNDPSLHTALGVPYDARP